MNTSAMTTAQGPNLERDTLAAVYEILLKAADAAEQQAAQVAAVDDGKREERP